MKAPACARSNLKVPGQCASTSCCGACCEVDVEELVCSWCLVGRVACWWTVVAGRLVVVVCCRVCCCGRWLMWVCCQIHRLMCLSHQLVCLVFAEGLLDVIVMPSKLVERYVKVVHSMVVHCRGLGPSG